MKTIRNSSHIDLKLLSESGQIFRLEEVSEYHFILPYKKSILHFFQKESDIEWESFGEEILEKEIEELLRINMDRQFFEEVCDADPFAKYALEQSPGMWLVKQDPWECLLGFILSQNKFLEQIKICVKRVAMTFGQKITTPYGDFWTTPTSDEILNNDPKRLQNLGLGYRAPYIQCAAEYVKNNEQAWKDIGNQPTLNIREFLMKIKGVGPKVADCVLLFGFARDEVIPFDVWLLRIMHELYGYPENAPYHHYVAWQGERFPEMAGWIQQVLFYHARKVAKRGVPLSETWFKEIEKTIAPNSPVRIIEPAFEHNSLPR